MQGKKTQGQQQAGEEILKSAGEGRVCDAGWTYKSGCLPMWLPLFSQSPSSLSPRLFFSCIACLTGDNSYFHTDLHLVPLFGSTV